MRTYSITVPDCIWKYNSFLSFHVTDAFVSVSLSRFFAVMYYENAIRHPRDKCWCVQHTYHLRTANSLAGKVLLDHYAERLQLYKFGIAAWWSCQEGRQCVETGKGNSLPCFSILPKNWRCSPLHFELLTFFMHLQFLYYKKQRKYYVWTQI